MERSSSGQMVSTKGNSMFAEFAAKEFPRAITRYHSTQSLHEPLLPLDDQVDQHVAAVLWSTILRFMGDIPEPRHTFLDTSALQVESGEETEKAYSLNNLMSTCDKLRFVVGLGINRPHLRDEIFCQLCKQVTNNPSSASLVKGWVLLSLCLGCFIPSEKVEKVLVSVMRCGPSDHAAYCDQKLARTKKNGTRKQPPNSLELEAAEQMLFPTVPLELMDGREVLLEVDSSTTAKELCEDAAEEMGCSHITGYGIQISMLDKYINLGCGSEKLMDAIWVCEQSTRRFGYSDNGTAWKIYYRKDVFTPLDDFLVDISWTDFAYNYVINGIKTGVTRLTRRFNNPVNRDGDNPHDPSSTGLRSSSSSSSIGSFKDFGLLSVADSCSDISLAEYDQDNSQLYEASTLERICETYSGVSKDVHTLKDYGLTNFVSADHNIRHWKQNGVFSFVWTHQLEPIKQPLLLRLVDNQVLSKLAVNMFSRILVYMHECATPRSSKYYKMELIREIFGPAVKQELLKDEVYCQIIKQLTDNEDKSSLQQGWELMFLCTGLFACSDELLKEVMLFLVSWSKYEVMAMKCLTLLRKTVQAGPRLYPPHFVEFAAATKRCEYILHKVSFPDLSSKTFNVDSRTRVKDLENKIGEKLKLSCLDGYSLFIQVFTKIVALNPEDFVFDAIQQWSETIEYKLPKPPVYNKAKGIPYKLLFLRRVWSNVCPGDDPIADAIFLYPQEVSKFLRGYYKLTIEEASYLAALILKQKFGDEARCPEITQMFEQILPHDMIDELFPELWRQYIITNCQKISISSESELRKEFLSNLQKHDRFGSAYFQVGHVVLYVPLNNENMKAHSYASCFQSAIFWLKVVILHLRFILLPFDQKSFQGSPKLITVGINEKAMHIIHPKSKDTIQTFPIKSIVSHYRENNAYTVQVQRSIDTLQTFTFYTTQDYEIANMVKSYIPK